MGPAGHKGYDYEDGTNLTYRVYASTKRMHKSQRDGRPPNLGTLVSPPLTEPCWRVQNLKPATKYFIRVAAVDSAGNESADESAGGYMMSEPYDASDLAPYVWDRRK